MQLQRRRFELFQDAREWYIGNKGHVEKTTPHIYFIYSHIAMNTSIIELVATNTGGDTLLDTFFFEQVTYKNVSFCQEKFFYRFYTHLQMVIDVLIHDDTDNLIFDHFMTWYINPFLNNFGWLPWFKWFHFFNQF